MGRATIWSPFCSREISDQVVAQVLNTRLNSVIEEGLTRQALYSAAILANSGSEIESMLTRSREEMEMTPLQRRIADLIARKTGRSERIELRT